MVRHKMPAFPLKSFSRPVIHNAHMQINNGDTGWHNVICFTIQSVVIIHVCDKARDSL